MNVPFGFDITETNMIGMTVPIGGESATIDFASTEGFGVCDSATDVGVLLCATCTDGGMIDAMTEVAISMGGCVIGNGGVTSNNGCNSIACVRCTAGNEVIGEGGVTHDLPGVENPSAT